MKTSPNSVSLVFVCLFADSKENIFLVNNPFFWAPSLWNTMKN